MTMLFTLDQHARPENLASLKIEKCNTENWSEMIKVQGLKDPKNEKFCFESKAVGAIANVVNTH